MTAVSFSQSEIVARLLEIKAARRAFDVEEDELFGLLQNTKKRPAQPVPLTFAKNVITWGGGALPIKGKGYKFIKVLYEADKMRLKIARLEKTVWKDDIQKGKTVAVKQNSFIVFLNWLAAKLEFAKFPYRLLPTRSKEKSEDTGEIRKKKPVKKRIRSVITGAKLRMK